MGRRRATSRSGRGSPSLAAGLGGGRRRARRRIAVGRARGADPARRRAGRVEGEADPLDWWRRGFALTYSAELRAERKGARRLGRRCRSRALSALRAGRRSRRIDRPARQAAVGAAADRRARCCPSSASPRPRHLRRRGRLYRLEDQPPRRDGHRGQALAAALAAAGRAQPAAAAAPIGRDSLGRARQRDWRPRRPAR